MQSQNDFCGSSLSGDEMKSILFVINTLGTGGAEKAMLELLQRLDLKKYELSLFVLTGQGELIGQVPKGVKILNRKYYPVSVHDRQGKKRLFKTVIRALFLQGGWKRIGYIIRCLRDMAGQGNIQKDKILWKILSDGAQKLEQEYDLAVAYLEGGASYYVASHVKAKKKAAFIHINYILAGYSRKLDEDCYLAFDRILTVAEDVKEVFLSVYPECKERTEVFYNLVDREKIVRMSQEEGGFSDSYDGYRILTVSRLVTQKALLVAVETMKRLKAAGKSFRWYVLGEGEMRKKLEEQIRAFGLEDDFILLGAVSNPFPYYVQCDLYVHTSYFEGKSIAIEEAQILGCAILVSDYSGVRSQVKDGVDGKICELDAGIMAEEIMDFADQPQRWAEYGRAASKRKRTDSQKEVDKLITLL